MAAGRGYAKVVEALLNKGAEIDPLDENISTPLHLAAIGNNVEVVRVLLEKRADRTVRDQDGLTPVQLMVGKSEMLALLRSI